MAEFTLESESIDVESIMEQIRTRIRQKRDENYSEERIRTLANTTLERFFDPTQVHASMLAYYQKRLGEKHKALRTSPEAPPSFTFDPDIIYRSSRGFPGRVLYRTRKLVSPILKFFFNPAPIVHALTMQQQINERQAEVISQMARTQTEFVETAALNYEVMNHLVVEMTRLSLEMKNHRMLVESIAGRLDFDERRVRTPEKPVGERARRTRADSEDAEATPEKRRRRRRRGRRRSGTTPSEGGATSQGANDVSAGGGATTQGTNDVSAEGGATSQGANDVSAESSASTADPSAAPPEPAAQSSEAAATTSGQPAAPTRPIEDPGPPTADEPSSPAPPSPRGESSGQ